MIQGGDKQVRAEIAAYSAKLAARGWVANHDGNLSVRAGDGYLATPTAFAKAAVTPDDVIGVGEGGKVTSGKHRVFSEWNLHATCYGARPDVKAVVHAHPPMATGFSVSGARFLERPFMAEPVVSLGAGIPTAPFAAPGPGACAALPALLAEHDAMLLANHGVLAVGATLEQAYLRLELVEHLANIAYFAHHTGGIRPLPESAIAALLEARTKAGLGPAARKPAASATDLGRTGGSPPVVVACGPAPPDATVRVLEKPRAAAQPSAHEIASIIREELARALKSR